MRALRKISGTQGLLLEHIPIPRQNQGEILLKVECAGICATDIPLYSGARKLPCSGPLVMGHEIVGTVTRDGGSLAVGTRAVVNMIVGCGQCAECKDDYSLGCHTSQRIGITRDGGFAEYLSIPAENALQIPDTLPGMTALFTDPLACALKGVEAVRQRGVRRALILGGGTIAFFTAALLRRFCPAAELFIIDRHPERRNWLSVLTRRCAASIDDYHGEQFDVFFEAAGAPHDFSIGLELLTQRGTAILLGLHYGELPTINTMRLLQREIAILPSLCYGRRHFEEALSLLSSGSITLPSEAIATYALNQPEEAFICASRKEHLKVAFSVAEP